MKQAIHMTHNRLVAGSNPAGATKFHLLNQYIEANFQGGFLFILQIPLPCFSLPIKI